MVSEIAALFFRYICNMERIKVTKNFSLDELVDPVTYFTEPHNGLNLLDMDAVNCLQLLRDLLGEPLTVNNWWNPYIEWLEDNSGGTVQDFSDQYKHRGNYQFSGFRPKWCKIGASRSAHRIGRAFDPKGDEHELFKLVEENAKAFYNIGLKRIEDPSITNGWLHIDTMDRNCKPNSIRVVDLKRCTKTIYV